MRNGFFLELKAFRGLGCVDYFVPVGMCQVFMDDLSTKLTAVGKKN